jgi:hypothetical protein
VIDRLPDRFGLAAFARVHAAHHALKFGELAHHVGGQIGLREPRRSRGGVGLRRGAEHLNRQAPGQPLDSRCLCGVRTQRLVEQQAVQARQPRFQARVPIGIPEEPRVAQPCRDHTLGVGGNALVVGRLRVRHGQEGRHQGARRRHHREEMLVVNQRGRQDFDRQREELGRDRAGHDRRKLHQIGHLFHQSLGLRVLVNQRPAADAAGVGLEVPHDAIAAFVAREDHEVLGELLAVLIEAAHELDLARWPGRLTPGTGGRRSRRPSRRPARAGWMPAAAA